MMQYHKCLILTILLIQSLSLSVYSQAGVVTTGGETVLNEIHLEWSLGEVFSSTVDLNSGYLTQGIIQPDIQKFVPPSNTTKFTGSPNISIYPNPAIEEIYVSIEGVKHRSVDLLIRDGIGQIIRTEKIYTTTNKPAISIMEIPPGLYFIDFLDPNGKRIKVCKFVKAGW